jgi:hypothetical protein
LVCRLAQIVIPRVIATKTTKSVIVRVRAVVLVASAAIVVIM